MLSEEDGQLITRRIGEGLTVDYSVRLLRQLQRQAERFGLGTQETEGLTALVSTVTENPGLNSAQQAQMLRDGLRELSTILSDDDIIDIVFIAQAQSIPTARAAFVIRSKGKNTKFIVYMR